MATAASPVAPAGETAGLLLDQSLRAAGLAPPGMAGKLVKLDLKSVRDLLFHLPRRYDDFSRPMTLAALREAPPEGPVSATVEIVELRIEAGFRRRVQRTVARLRDSTGEGEAVWFGRRYIERRLNEGQTVALSGKVEVRGWLPRFQNPEFGSAGDDALHAGRIVPVYRLTAGVTLPWLRSKIRAAIDLAGSSYPEYLPPESKAAAGRELPAISRAIESVHFPPDFELLDDALARLAFDELLALQLGMVARQRQRQRERTEAIAVTDDRLGEAIAEVERVIGEGVARRQAKAGHSPAGLESGDPARVEFTADQRNAVVSIRADLGTERPMMRLLQGDVGSGKTAVAALALCFLADAGRQGALLAPTDLLARQHAQTLTALLEPLGHDVTLLTGSLAAGARREALELIGAPVDRSTEGRSRGRVVVGTHALVQEAVGFADLRLVVVDEQHRFGVTEREALASKGVAPHVLLMTATPIPRTLGQIMHADLDVSDLRTPPAGRLKIGTGIRRTDQLITRVDENGRTREGALPLLVRQIGAGHRAFVVVPLVEDDPEAGARSVEAGKQLVVEKWQAAAAAAGIDAPAPAVDIVHGQMKSADRDQRMERFRQGEVQVLVGTTVLEVGVDVPEATVMLILDADRFGLAQLHQLRGRVGRGEAESFCVLVSDRYPLGNPQNDEEAAVRARLDAVASTHDGFLLAELDLEQRHEGELLGLTQSGLPPLRVASLRRPQHRELSLRAREAADALLDEEGRLAPKYAALERELTHGWLKRVGAGEVLSAGAGELLPAGSGEVQPAGADA